MKCAVFNCNASYNKNRKCAFFTFPKNPKLVKQWVHFCRRKDIFNTKAAWICGEHFREDDIETNLKIQMGFGSRKKLKPGAIPSVYSSKFQKNRNKVVSPLNGDVSVVSEPEPQLAESNANDSSTAEPIEIDPPEPTNLKAQMGFASLKKLKPGTIPNVDQLLHDCSDKLQRDTKKVLIIIVPIVNAPISSKAKPAELNANDLPTPAEPIEIDPLESTKPNGNKNISAAPVDENVTDTPSIKIIEDLKETMQKLKKENVILKEAREKDVSENNLLEKHLMKIESERKRMEEHLLQIFTTGQLKKIKTGKNNMHWNEDDIAKSITLYLASAKAYNMLRRMNFPLPGVRTLQRWAHKIDISPGVFQPEIMLGETPLDFGQH